MKTPDEIKKALACTSETDDCEHCAYYTIKADEDGWDWPEYSCIEVKNDALAYIQQLEADLQREKDQHQYTIDAANVMKDEALKFEYRIAQAEREKEAMAYDLNDDADCRYCQRKDLPKQCGRGYCSDCDNKECPCYNCTPKNNNFIWRGVCPENTKEET